MTNVTYIPRSQTAQVAPPTCPQLRKQARPTKAADILPTPFLRIVADNHAAAAAMPKDKVQDMAGELVARRALDLVDAAAARRRSKADAIVDALIANFTITGNPKHIWRADTVDAVLRDELASKGWPDCSPWNVYDVLRSLSDNPTVPLTLAFENGHHVMRGLRVQGAAV